MRLSFVREMLVRVVMSEVAMIAVLRAMRTHHASLQALLMAVALVFVQAMCVETSGLVHSATNSPPPRPLLTLA